MKTGKRGGLPRLALALLAVWALGGAGCDSDLLHQYIPPDPDPYVFEGEYTMIKVPVPEGGVTFPTGVNDDGTARVEEAYYIGETLVTQALWDTVARWAVFEKKVGKYYGFLSEHHTNRYIDVDSAVRYLGGDLPVLDYHGEGINGLGDTLPIHGAYVSPVWCNAYTEWYNEKYGTNYTPVYVDGYGNPKRGIDNYDYVRAAPGRTGFRLLTDEEWELAARWQGTDGVNAVAKVINSIDFSAYPLKFTKGNSASGARDSIANLNECSRVALFGYNYFFRPMPGKTRAPNALGIYDMSGNAPELAITYWTDSIKAVRTYRGGHYLSAAEELAVGNRSGSPAGSDALFGYRLARNAE